MVRSCQRCILDTHDDPDIRFDEQGVCHHCHDYESNLARYYHGDDPTLEKFHEVVAQAKQAGQGRDYDVLIGLSGGVDSTYVAYLCWKSGLRALAIHLDNGWNSELSVVNIKNILKATGFDLHTHVINWREFRDLQRAYFKAHVVDIEALTDHAIGALLLRVAVQRGIGFVFTGSSITTEGRLPAHWVHNKSDDLNIRAINKRFGEGKIRTFPILAYHAPRFDPRLRKIQMIDILDLYPYNKLEAKDVITRELSWRDYGGKHYESVFTRFYQGFILPKKFGIDKRKSHYSVLICAGQLARSEALELMKADPYPSARLLSQDYDFVTKKLGFSHEEFEDYLGAPRREHTDYPSWDNVYRALRPLSRRVKRALALLKALIRKFFPQG